MIRDDLVWPGALTVPGQAAPVHFGDVFRPPYSARETRARMDVIDPESLSGSVPPAVRDGVGVKHSEGVPKTETMKARQVFGACEIASRAVDSEARVEVTCDEEGIVPHALRDLKQPAPEAVLEVRRALTLLGERQVAAEDRDAASFHIDHQGSMGCRSLVERALHQQRAARDEHAVFMWRRRCRADVLPSSCGQRFRQRG